MLTPLVTKAMLEERYTPERIAQLAPDDTQIENACITITQTFSKAAREVHTELSINSLTPENLDADSRRELMTLVIDHITEAHDIRPDSLNKAAKRAWDWIESVKSGTATVTGLVRIGSSVAGATGPAGSMRIYAPKRKFCGATFDAVFPED